MNKILGLAFATALLLPSFSHAHTALFSCYDMGDGTIECEGGFSNGASAAGIKVYVVDASGKQVFNSALDENSYITLTKPSGNFTVTMDGGEGHSVVIKSADITE